MIHILVAVATNSVRPMYFTAVRILKIVILKFFLSPSSIVVERIL